MIRPTPITTSFSAGRAALTAVLLATAALSAQAADYTFAGLTDSGPLNPAPFSGSFSFDDPAPGFDGAIALDALSLLFAGQSYTLASADAGTAPVAWFAAGSLLGIDYQDSGAADPATRPHVQLLAGWIDISEAYFSYDTTGSGVEGFGSLGISAVPEPAGWALLLAGLGLVGLLGRRRSA